MFEGLPADAHEAARKVWGIVQTSVSRIVTSDYQAAQVVMYRLRRYIRVESERDLTHESLRMFLEKMLGMDEFWTALETLAEVRLLFTRIRGRPRQTHTLRINYTERLPAPPKVLPRPWRHAVRALAQRPGFYSRRVARYMLAWLGLTSIGTLRPAMNLGQAASYWTIFTVPDGIESIRCFWWSQRRDARHGDTVAVAEKKAAAGKHHGHGQIATPDTLALDVQIAPSSAIASAAGLAILLYLVGVYVYKAMPELIRNPNGEYATRLIGVGSILAATPATIAGALAYRGHTFVRRASRGPRTMVAGLAALAALLAVVMSLQGPGPFAEALALGLSLYSLLVAGIFVLIRMGPRWRKNERSRRRGAVKERSPNGCRKRQAYDTLVLLAPWFLVVLLAARGETALQQVHVFGSQFPSDVWRAWTGWV